MPAARIRSLAALKAATMACRECPIGEFATQSVTGEGRLKARLMLVGEQPGFQPALACHGLRCELADGAFAAGRGGRLELGEGKDVAVRPLRHGPCLLYTSDAADE